MEQPHKSAVVPLRPLTFGELFDAAIGLLREHASALLPVAFAICAAEQGLLAPLRTLAGVRPPDYFSPYTDRLAEYWIATTMGFATETMAIALLGAVAARAAAAAVQNRRMSARALLSPRGARPLAVLGTAVLVGAVAWIAALSCLVPWAAVYGLLGLAVPVVVVDGTGPFGGLWRSLRMSTRIGARACWVRLTGYISWSAIRTGLGFGGLALLDQLLPSSRAVALATGIAVWVLVDTIAYAALACLDAVLHLETRMRTEGLDIMAVRARSQGRLVDLAVPR